MSNKIPCTCPKGGMYERENGSTFICDKCDGSEWVEANNIENEVERLAIAMKERYAECNGSYTPTELYNEAVKTLTSLTEQHQNEKTFMLTEFEKVKKLREDEHQRELQIADDRWKANEQYRDKYMDAYTQGVLDGKKECQREKEAIVREIIGMAFVDFGYMEKIVSIIDIEKIATNHNIHYE